MDEITDVRKEIVAKVKAFSDAIVEGNVEDTVVKGLRIPQEYLDVCRDQNHPSCQKFRNRLFQYLMDRVGYYENIGSEEQMTIINEKTEVLFRRPVEKGEKELYMPRLVCGVKKALGHVEEMRKASKVWFEGCDSLKNVKIGRSTPGFLLSYERDPRQHVSIENMPSPAMEIEIDGKAFEVPENGAHLSSQRTTLTQPDEIEILLERLHHSNLHEDKPYYFRYITEVGPKDDISREFEKSFYDIDGKDTFTIETQVNDAQLLLYNYSCGDRNYLVMDYGKAITEKEMSELSFSVLVALGMIISTVHLKECWLMAYATADMKTEEGLFYRTQMETVRCKYRIFTSNAYPALVGLAQKIDPKNGERRACDIISNLKLSNGLPWFSNEVFGRLVENMDKYEDLRRGIFVVLMGSELPLEIQAATYCVSLEAISNLAPKIIGKDVLNIIKKKSTWREVRKAFKGLNADMKEKGKLNDEEYNGIEKKIDTMNNNFNNVILRALLDYYHYPMRQFDELTLHLRNVLLHGSIYIDKFKGRKPEDYLFELSINLHKLCCAIALLMSGYEGYIINNRKLYGFAGSYKAFIKIGNNVRGEYPKYREKDGFWKQVVRCGVCMWKFCSYLFVPQWGRHKEG